MEGISYAQDSIRLTADNLKALSHPLRVQILGLLRTHGPATASGLAARLDLNSGALSYHLRQLERYGFITEVTEQPNRRDRWWRAVHRSTEFDSTDLDPAAAEAGEAYELGVIAAINRSLLRAQAERRSWPPEWQKAYDMSDVVLQLTAEEAQQLSGDLLAVLRRYRQHTPGVDGPSGSRIVSARYQVVPIADGEGGGAA
jgi:DNA-binding transcriptional ArsR family regulator